MVQTDRMKHAVVSNPRPTTPKADAAATAGRGARVAAHRARGRAREALLASLDKLGDKQPTAEQAAQLMVLCASAFEPKSAAGRMVKTLWALAARGSGREV